MPLKRAETGIWTLEIIDGEQVIFESSHPSYLEALPRYLTAIDPVFVRAREVSEFNFLSSIFAVRRMQDAGWDPYETTQGAIAAIRSLRNGKMEGEVGRHLTLWLYGHIVEASEPYEFLANLIAVTCGGRFESERFPPRPNGAPLSPSIKIERLAEQATEAGLPDVVVPMQEAWNRDFRNAIFHADYSLHGSEVRTIRPVHVYSHDEAMTLVNRAMACHEAITILRTANIESYAGPVIIPCDPRFSGNPGEMATVIVREGFGAVGIKDAWTEVEIARGCIPYRFGRFTYEEMQMLEENPALALLPAKD
ncbi:hypothetical protein NUH88_07845 [Nisaea acidiphila]|uniref:Uncharacterized protein n=1 Tax=Nisaea acidiphila TaxID=1862145 RepID=A0A9J7AW66_9PROT|nr:hypothetical protein [Nisaea acidiphila]UUX51599.1 hypothetical protein NUH88_07845 [Nisaea acidiphila]